MSSVAERARMLEKGKVLRIEHEELKEVLEAIFGCDCRQHKIVIDHFGYDPENGKKGRRRIVKFWGCVIDKETDQVSSVNARIGTKIGWRADDPYNNDLEQIIEILPFKIWGVDRRGDLYADFKYYNIEEN